MMTDAPIIWRPNPGPQTTFLADPCDWVLYGGAAGGGKSDALLIDALGQIDDSRYQAILFRKSYPDLEELIARAYELYPACGGRWSKTAKTWTFPSGATIKFRYIERDEDARNYQGHQYQWIGFDELTHFSEWQWWFMWSRCRPRRLGQRCYMRASCNPDGKGLHWVKAMFVDAATPGETLRREVHDPVANETRTITQRFIPARLVDNPYLVQAGYGATLASLPEADRKALLDGDWNAYTGSVFKLIPGIHVLNWEQFKARTGHDRPPAEWNRFRVMDWGFARPFSVHWLAVDFEGRAYAYREWYGVAKDSKGAIRANVGLQMEPTTVAARIADIERHHKERMSSSWTGPDLFSAGTGDTTAGIPRSEYFSRQGVHFQAWEAGPKSRSAKKQALHERLAYVQGDDGTLLEPPALTLIVDPRDPDTCHHAYRTIPALEYDEAKGGEDVDTTAEDHAYDALSAFCLMRPWTPRTKQAAPSWLKPHRPRSGMVG